MGLNLIALTIVWIILIGGASFLFRKMSVWAILTYPVIVILPVTIILENKKKII